MKKRILVAGGTGYIGSHTVVELQNNGYEVIIVDNLSNSRADVVDSIEQITGIRPAFEKVDCLDYEGMDAVFTKYPGIEGIIHFAASKAVGESVQKPLLYYRNNLVSLINILELMPKHGVKGIIFSSSCTVYGQPDVISIRKYKADQRRNHRRYNCFRFSYQGYQTSLFQPYWCASICTYR